MSIGGSILSSHLNYLRKEIFKPLLQEVKNFIMCYFKFCILLFFFIFFSCHKDKLDKLHINTLSTNVQVQDRSNYCLNIPQLCEGKIVRPKNDRVLALVSSGNGAIWEVYIAELKKNEPSLLAKSPNGELYLLTKTTSNFLKSKEVPTIVPSALKAMLDIPLSALQSGQLSSADLQTVYGNYVNSVLSNGKNVFQISSNFDGTTNPDWLAFDFCMAAYLSTVMTYMEKLNIPFSSQSTYEAVVDEALKTCAGVSDDRLNAYYCERSNCNSVCVVENILTNPIVSSSPYLTQQVKLQYLDLLYGGMDSEVYTNLQATYNSTAVNATYTYIMNPANDVCEQLAEFRDLETPIVLPHVPLQTIPKITVTNLEGSGGVCNNATLVGISDDRHPLDEDLQFGTDNTPNWLPEQYLTFSNAALLGKWQVLNLATCALNLSLYDVTQEFSNLFFDNFNAGLEHSNLELNQACANTNEMKNFVGEFGRRFNIELSNGIMPSSIQLELLTLHPAWRKPYTFKGLQILINDTEQTFVYLQNFQWLNPEQTRWKGKFCFRVEDNYGLDDRDAIVYGPKHGGFYTWWMLQHDRGRAPFVNNIYITGDIEGIF